MCYHYVWWFFFPACAIILSVILLKSPKYFFLSYRDLYREMLVGTSLVDVESCYLKIFQLKKNRIMNHVADSFQILYYKQFLFWYA